MRFYRTYEELKQIQAVLANHDADYVFIVPMRN